MKQTCIIVDDEPLAIELIEKYLAKIEDIELLGSFEDGIDAFGFLQKNSVHLIFLDIEMPQLNGLELLKTLSKCPKVIITTAYRNYAPESYDLEVLDYLLKPIRFDRFMKAIDKFYKSSAGNTPFHGIETHENAFSDNFIFVRSDRKMIKVILNEVLYIESIKDYVKIVCQDKTIVSKKQISDLETELSQEQFLRIHRSYIVNKAQITAFTAQDVEIGTKEIPIGRNYRALFEQMMKK